MEYRLTDFLPTTKKELELRGWDEVDVILFSGDAYVDHPSFGAAVIGRTLEAAGYRVAIVPQPDWHGDYRDFKKLGRPRLFFGISPGCMDSMVNKYTANRRLRSEDAYSPDGRHDLRPEYPTIVYTRILKELFPDVPVVLGGIEASLRRLTHYDYWQEKLRPSILVDSGADLLIYGMGEKPIVELARRSPGEWRDVPQTVYLADNIEITKDDIVLHSHEECLRDKRAQAENFRHIEEQSNMMHAQRIIQRIGTRSVVVNPPYPPMTTAELDASFDLPYTRQPHPKYKGKRIPAYDMIKHSVNIHRGCFGGCAFCTISAHQGKFIACRSKESILREVRQVIEMAPQPICTGCTDATSMPVRSADDPAASIRRYARTWIPITPNCSISTTPSMLCLALSAASSAAAFATTFCSTAAKTKPPIRQPNSTPVSLSPATYQVD